MADTPFHEAASIFPLMEGEPLEALADNIRKHGLQLPIEVLDGKVIDGRNRYKACLLAGIDPEEYMIEVDPEDAIGYVLCMNLHRRHLTTGQRAKVGARIKAYEAERAKERQKAGGETAGRGRPKQVPVNLPEPKGGDARDKAAEQVNVSGKSVDQAAKVLDKGSSKLQTAVDAGEVAVSTAAKLADLPKAAQNEALAGGKAAIREAILPEWAQGPTPQEQAKADPECRWSAVMHKLCVFMNSTRDHGGIAKLAGKWAKDTKADYVKELRRIRGELQKWINILEGKT